MSEQGVRLLRTADAQISELIAALSAREDSILAEPCPERAKLGDGTIGAVAWHTAAVAGSPWSFGRRAGWPGNRRGF